MKIQHKRILRFTLLVGGVAILYVTGLHREVIGLVQRDMLQTGIMNPDLDHPKKVTSASGEKVLEKADFDVSFYNEENELVSLQSLSDKPIFINFWATWCPPCIAEMPGISNLYDDTKSEVNFLMVSFDTEFEKAIAVRDKKGYTFPIYRLSNDLPDMYNTGSLPTTIVIDAQGNLVLKHLGMADYDTDKFRKYLEELDDSDKSKIQ